MELNLHFPICLHGVRNNIVTLSQQKKTFCAHNYKKIVCLQLTLFAPKRMNFLQCCCSEFVHITDTKQSARHTATLATEFLATATVPKYTQQVYWMIITTQVNNSIVRVDPTYTAYYVKNYRTFRKLDLYLSPNYLLFIHLRIKDLFNSTFKNTESSGLITSR